MKELIIKTEDKKESIKKYHVIAIERIEKNYLYEIEANSEEEAEEMLRENFRELYEESGIVNGLKINYIETTDDSRYDYDYDCLYEV